MTNKQRIARARRTVVAHRHHPDDNAPLTDEDIADLLADLRHLCDHTGFDFVALNRSSRNYYLSENDSG